MRFCATPENSAASVEDLALVSTSSVVVRPIRDEDVPLFEHLATGLGQGRLRRDRTWLIALGAWVEGEPAGLFLGRLYKSVPDSNGELSLRVLTLRVEPLYRGRGLATLLLSQAEAHARAKGCCLLSALIAEGSPEGPAAQALAARAAWTRFRLNRSFYKIPWQRIESSHWATRVQPWPNHCEVFAWRDATPAERALLLERRDDRSYFDPALDPFKREPDQTRNSVGLRIRGEIAGWAVSWYLNLDQTARNTMSGTRLFVRQDLRRRGCGAMLLAEHIKGGPAAGIEYAVYSIFPDNQVMLRLFNKHLKPYVSHSREIWEMRKVLSARAV